MNSNEIKDLLADPFKECDVEVEGEEGHYKVTIVGDVFEGLTKVKKQQMVYGHLNEKIKSGEIHAVMMTTLTPAEKGAT